MPWIRFAKKNRPDIEAELGSNLMQSLLDQGVPVGSSCGGQAVCGKCRVQILEGGKNLSIPRADEKIISEKLGIPGDERLSCQAMLKGDILVDTTYW